MEGSQPSNPIPSESSITRYKFLWRAFLIFNFALGGYMFAQAQTSKKERGKQKIEAPAKEASTPVAEIVPVQEEPVFSSPITMPQIVQQPIPEDQQREIFQWMLEEKRKLKPQNREEKKRINEEKAILKDFIRAKSIPHI